MNGIKKFSCVAFTFFAVPVHASERYIDAAADCAAQMFVMTAVGKSVEGLDKYFENQAGFTIMMTSLYMEKKLGQKITNGMVLEIREQQLRNLQSNDISTLTLNSISNCLGWSASLARIMRDNQDISKQRLKSLILEGPKPNSRHDYPFNDRDQLSGWISLAKTNWRMNGYMTPGKLRDRLKQ